MINEKTQGVIEMKNGIILIGLMCAIMITGISHSEEVVTGRIIEGGSGERFIQVGNRNYIVEMVLVDTGSGTPVLGGLLDLEVGQYVEIQAGEKNKDGFWRAEKVVILPEPKESP